MYDLVISGKALVNGSLEELNICISGDSIVRISKKDPGSGDYDRIIKAGKGIILPGAIDLHTHMRDPGLTRKEDFSTGTASAAFGGVTTIVDMPNTIPPTSSSYAFMEKKEIAMKRSHIDFGLNAVLMDGVVPDNFDDVIEDPAFGGFKVFLGESTGSLVLSDIGQLNTWKNDLRKIGKPVSVHAESGPLLRNMELDPNDILSSHLKMRPAEAEEDAVIGLMKVMGENMNLVHLLHMSSSIGIEAAIRTPATIEVTPHHLLLDAKGFAGSIDIESKGKVNPPIRTVNDRSRLWSVLRSGGVYTIGSDHAPHLLEEKESEVPPSGMPGVETMLPLLMNSVMERLLDLPTLVNLISSNPARRMGLARKGSIKEGNLADLMIVDPGTSRKIRGDDLHSKCGWTPYEGMMGSFPSMVFSRGTLTVEGENLCVPQGSGKPMHL